MAEPLKLKIAIGDAPHTSDLKSGAAPIAGVSPEFVEVKPIIGAFRRMVRNLEFDVCEMAPVTYTLARAQGAPFIALPIFLLRLLHHEGILCREGSGISKPSDLEGKRVGVRAYTVTTGVWKRGIMVEDFGLDCAKVTWVVDDEDAVKAIPLPDNVVHAVDGRSLVSLWNAGDLDAAFTGPAGIGRAGRPSESWNVPAQSPTVASYPLFTDGDERAADFYRRTRVYPHHGLLVVKEEVLQRHPWVAQSLFDAAVASKRRLLDALAEPTGDDAEVERYRKLSRIVGSDPLPYGLEINRPSIDALNDYMFRQGLVAATMPIDRLFLDLN